MSLGELVVELGIKGNIKPLQDAINKTKNLTDEEKKLAQAKAKVAQQIDKGIRAFRNITASISASIWAINKLSDALLNNNQHWINLLRQSNITLESFQKYGQVANILDRSLGVENATQSLQSLEQQLYKLQLTGEGASGFLLAGINPMGKSTEQVIEDIRSRISGMDDRQATFLLNQMGIDPRMLGMLRLSRQELEAINNELKNYRLTEEQRKEMQKLGMQIDISRKKLEYFKDKAVMKLLPHLAKWTEIAVKLNEQLIKFVNLITKSFNEMSSLQKGILGVVTAIAVLKVALWGLATHPVIATLTLLGLLIEDIMAWLSGGKSGIGYLLGAIDNIVEDERTPKWIRDLLYIISHADALKGTLDEIADNTKKVVEDVKNKGKKYFNQPIEGNILPSFTGGMIPLGLQPMTNTTNNNRNVVVNQNNTINTNQAGQEVMNQLRFVQQF